MKFFIIRTEGKIQIAYFSFLGIPGLYFVFFSVGFGSDRSSLGAHAQCAPLLTQITYHFDVYYKNYNGQNKASE